MNSSRGPRIEPPTLAKVKAAVGDWSEMPLPFEQIPGTSNYSTMAGGKVLNDGDPRVVVVMGDSHANMLAHRFIKLYEDAKTQKREFPTIVYKAINGAPAVPCNMVSYTNNIEFVKRIKARVLLHVQAWAWHIDPKPNSENEPVPQNLRCYNQASIPEAKLVVDKFFQDMKELRELGVEVFVAVPNAYDSSFDPRGMFDVNGLREDRIKPFNQSVFASKFPWVIKVVNEGIAASGVRAIDLTDNYCVDGMCDVVDRYGNPIFKDWDHFRPFFARHYAQSIDITVETALKPK